jgi:hypothetical protein
LLVESSVYTIVSLVEAVGNMQIAANKKKKIDKNKRPRYNNPIMARFKYTDNSHGQFMAVNLKEQLLPDTFEWTIDYLVNKLDMSLFEQNYHNDERGAAAYSPRVLLKIILYCYSRGIITLRKKEKEEKVQGRRL